MVVVASLRPISAKQISEILYNSILMKMKNSVICSNRWICSGLSAVTLKYLRSI